MSHYTDTQRKLLNYLVQQSTIKSPMASKLVAASVVSAVISRDEALRALRNAPEADLGAPWVVNLHKVVGAQNRAIDTGLRRLGLIQAQGATEEDDGDDMMSLLTGVASTKPKPTELDIDLESDE